MRKIDMRCYSYLVGLLLFGLAGLSTSCGGQDAGPGSMMPESPRWVHVGLGGRFGNCLLSNRGKVRCWGNPEEMMIPEFPVPEDVRLTSMSNSGFQLCGITTESKVWCYGDGRVAQGTDSPGDFVDVSVQGSHACALRDDGTARCWGNNESGQSVDPIGVFDAIDTAFFTSFGLRPDGSIEVWGYEADEEYGFRPPAGKFKQLSVGQFACAVEAETDEVQCWNGLRLNAPLPTEPVSRLFRSSAYGMCAELKESREPYCWGVKPVEEYVQRETGWSPEFSTQLPVQERFLELEVDYEQACGITDDARVICWGPKADEYPLPELGDGEWLIETR